jgi:acetyl esterase/lipase
MFKLFFFQIDCAAYMKGKEKVQPWYLADKVELEAKVDRLKELTTNPYISPLMYDKFERHKDTKLFILALHFDPFLDDNVTMAKMWKGEVEMDVFDGLQHGFLNFMPFVDEARKANAVCVKRLYEAIHC